jgi:hypothetical protein
LLSGSGSCPVSLALTYHHSADAIPESGTGNTGITPPGCPWLPVVLPEPVGDLTGVLLHGRDAGEGVGGRRVPVVGWRGDAGEAGGVTGKYWYKNPLCSGVICDRDIETRFPRSQVRQKAVRRVAIFRIKKGQPVLIYTASDLSLK